MTNPKKQRAIAWQRTPAIAKQAEVAGASPQVDAYFALQGEMRSRVAWPVRVVTARGWQFLELTFQILCASVVE